MQIVNLDRGRGKTYFLVKHSAKTGYPILCYTNTQAKYIKDIAKNLKLTIPEPIAVGRFNFDSVFRGRYHKQKYLIDDVDLFFKCFAR